MPPPVSIRTVRGRRAAVNSVTSLVPTPEIIPYVLKMKNNNKNNKTVVLQQRNKTNKNNKNKKKNKNKSNNPANATMFSPPSSKSVSAPVSFGVCMTNSLYSKFGGAPLRVFERVPGTRLVGCGMFHFAANPYVDSFSSSGSYQLGTPAAAVSSTWNLFGDTGTNETNFIRRVVPEVLGDRPLVQSSFFGYYAIRKLSIRYTPLVPTSTAGTLAFGLHRSSLYFAGAMASNHSAQGFSPSAGSDTLKTLPGVMQLVPSMLTPVWEPCSIEYTYTGSTTWSCQSSFETGALLTIADLDKQVQLWINAAGIGLTASTAYGYLMVQYVVDYYDPVPYTLQGNLSARRPSYLPPFQPVEPSLVVTTNEANLSSSVDHTEKKDQSETTTPSRSKSQPPVKASYFR